VTYEHCEHCEHCDCCDHCEHCDCCDELHTEPCEHGCNDQEEADT
jgi:hypothetical protein